MKATVKPYLPKPGRLHRSIVVVLPSNHPRRSPTAMSDRQFERWQSTSCNKTRLKRFGQEVAKKFGLPKPRVRRAGISHRVSCFIYVYEGSGTPAERRLFHKVFEYVMAHAPKSGKHHDPRLLSWVLVG